MTVATDIPNFPMPRIHPLEPPPAYREHRDAGRPVFRARLVTGQVVWLVTGYDEATAVLTDQRFSSDPTTLGYPSYIPGDTPIPPGFFLNQDPPAHTRLRRLVAREFLIARMERIRPRMQSILHELLDDLVVAGNRADLVQALAYPMAATVICELLDVPVTDAGAIVVPLTDTVLDRRSSPEQAGTAVRDLMAYFDGLVTARRKRPGEDMLSRLSEHEAEGDISHAEFAGLAALLLLSGYDTMAQMIGLGAITLLEHPEQLAILRADPTLYPQAVEELLRYLSINHAGLPRAATTDLELGGQHISAGDGLLVLINAANRDPAVFTEPDRFDIDRRPTKHLAFGYGFHKCIGLTLARVELPMVYEGLFTRLPDLRLNEPISELPFRHDMVLYGAYRVPVTWDTALPAPF